ncbi:MAG TPA: serine hydrolase domain-containing protein [Candidatus Saccharimonadales bacterium]|nr:serine hydrolase domain-containing protein [Candidatus Saccharimonadales bacterium]
MRRKLVAGIATATLLLGRSGIASAAGVEQNTRAADAVFADLQKPGSPGCAMAVFRDGKIVYAKGYGLANLEEHVAIKPSSVFDIGSTSKQFTAASILLLERQGRLSVSDDVRKYIPELPDYGKKITILHLLNHTSGLRDYLTLMELAGTNTDSVTTDEDALGIINRQKALNFDPGSEWLYSNTGFFLLSIIVKRVSGQSLREFAAANIFSPLRMNHTEYRDDHTSLVENRALAYEPAEHGRGFRLDVSYFEQTGDGAVHTSVEDLQKWDENFYSGTVGGTAFLSEMQKPGKLNNGKALNYAKGLFMEDYRGLPAVRHGGSWGGYRAELLRFPRQHFSVACLCNVGNANPEDRAERVAEVFLGSLMKPKPAGKRETETEPKHKPEIAPAEEQLKAYAGEYFSEELAAVYRLEMKDGKLRLTVQAGPGHFVRLTSDAKDYLRPTAPDELELAESGVTIHFKRNAGGDPAGFTLDAGRTKGVVFDRVWPGKL